MDTIEQKSWCYMYEVLSEIRNWLTLCLAVAGGFITIQTYLNTQKQRRLENSFRLLKLFNESLHEGDLEAWIEMFHATSEPTGVTDGYFVYSPVVGALEERSLSDLFSEGPPDNGAIERMTELFDLISFEALNNTIDFRVVYFQLGQLMDSVYMWLTKVESLYEKGSFVENNYPNFARLYKEKLIDKEWATKTYTHTA